MHGFLRVIGGLANAAILFFLVVILVRMFLESQKQNLDKLPGGALLVEMSNLFLEKFMKNLLPALEGKSLEIVSVILLIIFYILIKIFLLG